MEVRVSYKHMKASESLNHRVQEKVSSLIERYLHHPTDAHVTFAVDHHDHVVDCHITASGGTKVHATAKSDHMYAAVDQLISKLDALLNKQKTKMNRKNHDSLKNIAYDSILDGEYMDADEIHIASEATKTSHAASIC